MLPQDVPERNEAETATKEWREQGDGTEDIEAQRASLKYDSAPEDEDEGADEAAAEEGEEEEDEQAEEEAEEQAEAEEQEEPHEGPKEEVNMGGATSAVLRRRQGRDASVSRGKAKKTSSPEIGFMWGKRPEGKQQQRRADAVVRSRNLCMCMCVCVCVCVHACVRACVLACVQL